MITVEFSEQDLKAIAYERFHHPVPRVQRRMEVLWLKSQGLSHQRIAKLAGVCGNAVTKYLKMYRSFDKHFLEWFLGHLFDHFGQK